MATAYAPSLILGERPDGSGRQRFQSTRRNVRRLAAPGEGETVVELLGTTSLAEAAARIEEASGEAVILEEAGLPAHFQARLPLALLRRQAARKGKRLLLRATSVELRRIGSAAEIEVLGPEQAPVAGASAPSEAEDDGPPDTASTPPLQPGSFEPFSLAGSSHRAAHAAASRARSGAAGTEARSRTVPPTRDSGRGPRWAAARSPLLSRTATAGGGTGARRHSSTGRRWGTDLPLPGLRSRLSGRAAGRRALQESPWAAAAAEVAARLGAAVATPESQRGLALAGAVVLLAALFIWTVLPTAAVELSATTEPWSVELPVVVDPQIKQPDPARGRLPGRAISQEVVETAQAPTSGRRTVPDAPASGQVVFINKSDKPVTVPKGSIVLAGTTKFATQEEVTVQPTALAGQQQRFGMIRASVVAVVGGPAGNVDRYQINKLDGPLGGTLDVQNDAPLRGGTERVIAYVTAEDRKKLQESLQRTLTERLMQQVRSQVPASDRETVVPWTGQNPAVVESTFSKNVDEEAQTVSLTLKLRYGATAFANDAYNTLVRQLAAGRLSQTRAEYRLVDQALKPEPPSIVAVNEQTVQLTARAGGTIVPRLDAGAVRAAVANRPLPEAHAYLRSLPGVKSYALRSWPGWMGRLPWLGWRITVGITH
ncbi:MAG TPA: hypothetical protein VHS99_07070 [Chloroflexota bacterium]|nr:hypothetical protein [Chloroflexota bacterium]